MLDKYILQYSVLLILVNTARFIDSVEKESTLLSQLCISNEINPRDVATFNRYQFCQFLENPSSDLYFFLSSYALINFSEYFWYNDQLVIKTLD